MLVLPRPPAHTRAETQRTLTSVDMPVWGCEVRKLQILCSSSPDQASTQGNEPKAHLAPSAAPCPQARRPPCSWLRKHLRSKSTVMAECMSVTTTPVCQTKNELSLTLPDCLPSSLRALHGPIRSRDMHLHTLCRLGSCDMKKQVLPLEAHPPSHLKVLS